tara:strand:+ start:2175 stop:2501 length:327 start_codon:yes stop_codon:yes gene_type:complete
MKKRKRRSIKSGHLLQGVLFFLFSVGSIICLIVYLWMFKYIDESILAIEIQNTTARELKNEIDEIKNKIEKLSRSDVITKRAKKELGMIVAVPETLIVAVKNTRSSDL